MSDTPKTLTMAQACAYAHVSRRTIYNWLAAGKITRLETPSGMPRFYEHELVRNPETPSPLLHTTECGATSPVYPGSHCTLPLGHDQNHYGPFAYGVAQWTK